MTDSSFYIFIFIHKSEFWNAYKELNIQTDVQMWQTTSLYWNLGNQKYLVYTRLTSHFQASEDAVLCLAVIRQQWKPWYKQEHLTGSFYSLCSLLFYWILINSYSLPGVPTALLGNDLRMYLIWWLVLPSWHFGGWCNYYLIAGLISTFDQRPNAGLCIW